jgi:hypothetical protein
VPPIVVFTGGHRVRSSILAEDVDHPSILHGAPPHTPARSLAGSPMPRSAREKKHRMSGPSCT